MTKIIRMLRTSHVQMAIAAGISIIAFAWFSKKVLADPINPLFLAVPPLIEAAYEGFLKKNKAAKFMKTGYWICAILISTAIIILFHMIR